MSSNGYDVAVIGSGPGGFTCAVRAAQLGAKVVLIEKTFIGGTCLNCGCIPTKFLWQTLKIKQEIQKSNTYGLKANLESVDFSDIVEKKNKNILNLGKGMESILCSYNVDIVKGQALFKDINTLTVSSEDKIIEIFASKIVIATGTKPKQIKDFKFDGNKIISSTDILNLRTIPESMLIVGGGAIGIEMATIFAGFGSQVSLAECQTCLLEKEDTEVSLEVQKNLSRQGVELMTGCTTALSDINKYEKVLIVTGRTPNSKLGLEIVKVEIDKDGFIKTDNFCKTNVDNIYAVGDINGKNLLAYTAQNEGKVVAENIVSGNFKIVENGIIPQVVFSMPQTAWAKVKNLSSYKNLSFGKFLFTANSRAFIENKRTGFVKCAVDILTKRPLAFWVVGACSDELIHTACQILKNGGIDIKREMFFHPSLSEGLLNAYEDALGVCTETVKRFKKDIL
jgi:dihydrolipoamide dehydrogenase